MGPKIRIYPLRKTAQAWKIPVRVVHTCDETCSYFVYITEGGFFVKEKNPDYIGGKCPRFGKEIPAYVQLKNFDVETTLVGSQPLHNPDEIVIGDTKFDVVIRYPLRDPVRISMFAPHETGFTRRELIDSLQQIYEFIYREEERTATATSYEYREDCPECAEKEAAEFLRSVGMPERCTICYCKEGRAGTKLPCGHIFHTNCITPWIESNNTCPLCRQYVKSCDSCKGLGFISQTRENVVIPPEFRGGFRNRNTTDGLFGIWGHDFEDLYLEKLFYNRAQKRLEISVGS